MLRLLSVWEDGACLKVTGSRVRVPLAPHCLRKYSKSWQTTCRMIAVRWTGLGRRSPSMLIRITCRYRMLNWQQVIEVERLGGPCAGNREASNMDRNREFRRLMRVNLITVRFCRSREPWRNAYESYRLYKVRTTGCSST
jgi:hypothetical protein